MWPAERMCKLAQARRRSLGNIQFIGHLYKQHLLTEKIMHACMMHLLVCLFLATLCGSSAPVAVAPFRNTSRARHKAWTESLLLQLSKGCFCAAGCPPTHQPISNSAMCVMLCRDAKAWASIAQAKVSFSLLMFGLVCPAGGGGSRG